jgi:deazaflavin-dependent oxidoreductase (nitroreductase family)
MTNQNDRNLGIIEEFRQNDGKVGGNFEGRPLLLLTTTGAKSGHARTAPVMYLADGDRWLIFASKAGSPRNPDWFHNLTANPDVTIEVGTETIEARAAVAGPEERDTLYAKQVSLYPQFGEYEQRTTRKIPVVVLSRRG